MWVRDRSMRGVAWSRVVVLATLMAADFTVTQAFDGADRLVSRAVPGQANPMTYEYDENGQLIQAIDASGTTTLAYDDAGQLTDVAGPAGTFAYTYTDAGQVASRTYPSGGAVTYTYDEDGAVASMSADGKTTTFAHDANQQLATITYPASVDMVETRAYDRTGRVASVDARATGAPDPATRFDYQRDPVGNPVVIERTSGTTTDSTAYDYDSRDWLVAECFHVVTCTGATDAATYTYDKNGNRTQEVRTGTIPRPGTIDYDYDDADQLVEIDDGTSRALAYDADGNLTTGGRVWNALGQLVQSNDGTATTYAYDALGNRRSITTPAGTKSMSWDINNPLPLLARVSGAGVSATNLRWGS